MTGLIIKNSSNLYTILEEGGETHLLQAIGKIKYAKETIKVGDYVEFNDLSITKVLKRRNSFIRPKVANVDYIVICSSLTRPALSLELLDKFLINVIHREVEPILLFTKKDLLSKDEFESLDKTISYYKKYFKVFYQTKNSIEDEDKLIDYLKGKIGVVSGQTGSGKSHFLNLLSPELELKTDDISLALNRGKHTTRTTELYSIKGLLIADSPGFSALDFDSITTDSLMYHYPDFEAHREHCKYSTCSHTHEPSCAIKKAVEEGKILKERYDNYLKFYEVLKGGTK